MTSQIITDTEPWMARGLCGEVNPELFFPEKGGAANRARAICERCSVTAECLQYALDTAQAYGVWGGYSREERLEMKKKGALPTPRHCKRPACSNLIPGDAHGNQKYCSPICQSATYRDQHPHVAKGNVA